MVQRRQVISPEPLLALLKDGNIDNFPRYAQPNATYARLSVAPGQCDVIQWGIATHLRHLSQT
ncbi:hypothetical protein ACUU3S_001058 [Cronobacter dublinensis]